VVSVAESHRGGRRPDLSVCGTGVEVKSFVPIADRRRDPTPQSVFNKLASAAGQAAHVVLVGHGSGLSAATVRRGLALYAAAGPTVRQLSSVRVLGDGYDLAWTARAGPELRPSAGLGLGL
jgi:hypothetical protein